VKLQKIFNVLIRHEMLKGQVLFTEGDPVNGLYLVEHGEVTYNKVIWEDSAGCQGSKWMQPRLFSEANFKSGRTAQVYTLSGV
jgi:hypothetical protein